MTDLEPAIALIQSALFGAPDEASSEDTGSLVTEATGDIAAGLQSEPKMPAFLNSAIAQAIAADRAYGNLAPASGQVRLILRIPGGRPLARPLAVLLERMHAKRTELWTGWMVSPDADYAGDTDLVLDERDEPFDPIASMVQAWNPVRVVILPRSPVAAILGKEKIAVVRMLHDEASGTSKNIKEPPNPGLVAARDFAGGVVALTGTPLAKSNDPRTTYRELYGQAAQELSAASDRVAVPEASLWEILLKWFANPVLGAVLATLAVVQFGVIGLLWPHPTDETAQLRSIPPVPSGPRLRVHFNPDVVQREVHAALHTVGAQIIAGPDENGFFVLQLPTSLSAQQGAQQLRQIAGLVDTVEVFDATRR